MQLTDLLFIVSFLALAFLIIRLVVLLVSGKTAQTAGALSWLLGFLCLYVSALIVTSGLMPRRFLAPDELHCFDDWCVAASTAAPAGQPGKWNVTLRVESVARRIRQRETNIFAEVEDTRGQRYKVCSVDPSGASLSDDLGPGESFPVRLEFCLPADAQIAGVVVHHGAFPAALIVGDDEAWLHRPALTRLVFKY